jgi:hypothetical protein
MTKDLALLVGDKQAWLTTEGFLDKVDENLNPPVRSRPSRRSARPGAGRAPPAPRRRKPSPG